MEFQEALRYIPSGSINSNPNYKFIWKKIQQYSQEINNSSSLLLSDLLSSRFDLSIIFERSLMIFLMIESFSKQYSNTSLLQQIINQTILPSQQKSSELNQVLSDSNNKEYLKSLLHFSSSLNLSKFISDGLINNNINININNNQHFNSFNSNNKNNGFNSFNINNHINSNNNNNNQSFNSFVNYENIYGISPNNSNNNNVNKQQSSQQPQAQSQNTINSQQINNDTIPQGLNDKEYQIYQLQSRVQQQLQQQLIQKQQKQQQQQQHLNNNISNTLNITPPNQINLNNNNINNNNNNNSNNNMNNNNNNNNNNISNTPNATSSINNINTNNTNNNNSNNNSNIKIINEDGVSTNKRKRRPRAPAPFLDSLYCHSCGETQTSQWRRGPDGCKSLCNACGIRFANIVSKERALTVKEKNISIGALLNDSAPNQQQQQINNIINNSNSNNNNNNNSNKSIMVSIPTSNLNTPNISPTLKSIDDKDILKNVNSIEAFPPTNLNNNNSSPINSLSSSSDSIELINNNNNYNNITEYLPPPQQSQQLYQQQQQQQQQQQPRRISGGKRKFELDQDQEQEQNQDESQYLDALSSIASNESFINQINGTNVKL